MLNNFFILVALPLVIGTALFTIIWLWLSYYKYKEFPEAVINGSTRSKYLLTRGVEKGLTDFFYDLDTAITSHTMVKTIIEWYLSSINEAIKKVGPVERIAFIEKDSGPVGAIILAGTLVEKTKIPAIIVRLRRRLLVNSIKGDEVSERTRAILITDVLTSGGGLRKATHKLRLAGVDVQAAVFLVSRTDSEGVKKLEKELGISLFYALAAKDKKDLEKYRADNLLIKKKRKNKKGTLQSPSNPFENNSIRL